MAFLVGKKVFEAVLASFLFLSLGVPGWAAGGFCSTRFSAIKEGVREFSVEVVDTRGRRIFLKDRQQGRRITGLSWLNAILMNPVATTLDTPRQGTWLTSAMGYFLLLDLPSVALDAWSEQEEVAAARKRVKSGEIPGAGYIWDLMMSGFASGTDGANAILRHQEVLGRWAENRAVRFSPLPRVFDLTQVGLVASDEVKPLDGLMRRILSRTMEDARHLPGFKAGDFPALLLENFKKALATDPIFGKKPKASLELISTAFWPSIRGANLTDVEAGKILFVEKIKQEPYRQIAEWTDQSTLSIGEAYRMVEDLKNNPQLILEKKLRGSEIFPPGRAEPLERPDFPRFRDEFSLWRILFQDPRFFELKNSWLKNEASDLETLTDLELTRHALEQILEVDRKTGSLGLDDQAVKELFGSQNSDANVLLVASKNEVLFMAERRRLSAEQLSGCFREVAEFWRRFHREEASQIREGVKGEAFLQNRTQKSAKKKEAYNEILKNCPH